MNPFLSAFLGAATLAACVGVYLVVRKTWTLLDGLIQGSKQIPDLVGILRELLETARMIAAALEALHLALGTSPSSGAEPLPAAPARPKMPIFPGPAPIYPVQYEAAEEETEVVETTDAEFAQLEEAEAVRERGFTLEPDQSIIEQPPGVTKDA